MGAGRRGTEAQGSRGIDFGTLVESITITITTTFGFRKIPRFGLVSLRRPGCKRSRVGPGEKRRGRCRMRGEVVVYSAQRGKPARLADSPTRRLANSPTRRLADSPTRRRLADSPTRRLADPFEFFEFFNFLFFEFSEFFEEKKFF